MARMAASWMPLEPRFQVPFSSAGTSFSGRRSLAARRANNTVFITYPPEIIQYFFLYFPFGANADPVNDLHQQVHEVISDFLTSEPEKSA